MGCSGWWRRVGTIKLTNLLIDISFQLDRPSSLNWFTFSAQSKTPLVLASCCAAINLLWHFCTRLSNLGESERKQRLPYAFSRSVASGGRGLDSVGSRVKRCSVWDSDQRVVMNMKRQLRWEGGRTKKKTQNNYEFIHLGAIYPVRGQRVTKTNQWKKTPVRRWWFVLLTTLSWTVLQN